MTIRNGDMPAMPNNNPETYPTPCPLQWGYGLTKRELFAMAAMQGLTSSPLETEKLSHAANKSLKVFVVEQAVVIADALLAELDKAGGE